MRGRVAFLALQIGVLTFELVARQSVVEFLLGWFPADQVEIFAVVLEVAAHTILAVGVLHLHLCVIAVLVGECFGNFLMTIKTFVGGSARAKLVTGVALRGAAQRGMSFR